MSSQEDFAESEEYPLLTMREATKILRIGRTLGYALAHENLNSGGTSGLPVIQFSKECYRVPRWAADGTRDDRPGRAAVRCGGTRRGSLRCTLTRATAVSCSVPGRTSFAPTSARRRGPCSKR